MTTATAAFVVRRLWPSDHAAFRDHLIRLDPETRRNRFASAMSNTAVEAYARHAIDAQGSVYGAFVAGVLRGVAELRPLPARAGEREAEAAFSVEAPFRRQGIGTALFARVALVARNRAIRRLQVRCLPHNKAMQGLARKVGASLKVEGYEAEGYVTLDLPTPMSLWRESIDQAIDLSLAVFCGGIPRPVPALSAVRG